MSQNVKSPWIGRLPKIGIRPVIDGRRRGVRESLEDQVMAMARNAAEFLSANLRHPTGEPVGCVIADTNIGLTGVTGTITQTNLGVRYAFTPSFLADVFVGFNTGAGLNLAQTAPSLGVAAHWGF